MPGIDSQGSSAIGSSSTDQSGSVVSTTADGVKTSSFDGVIETDG